MVYETDSWRIVVLEHDPASKEIADFFEKIWAAGIIRKDVGEEIAHDKAKVTNKIKKAVGNLEGRILDSI